ncbi:MAG: hypothetical protein II984_06135 [Clostridia bacterium]|nr:hypothetical protein [Clostridia bacterium]
MKHKTIKIFICCFLCAILAVIVGFLSVLCVLRINSTKTFEAHKQIKEEFEKDANVITASLKSSGIVSTDYEIDIKEKTKKFLTVPIHTKQTIELEISNVKCDVYMEYSYLKNQKHIILFFSCDYESFDKIEAPENSLLNEVFYVFDEYYQTNQFSEYVKYYDEEYINSKFDKNGDEGSYIFSPHENYYDSITAIEAKTQYKYSLKKTNEHYIFDGYVKIG